jgi:hypothetical protein
LYSYCKEKGAGVEPASFGGCEEVQATLATFTRDASPTT